MYRQIFLQDSQCLGGSVLGYDREPRGCAALTGTFIFSSIGDALSRAYSSTKDTVSEVADKVSESVSDAYDATSRTASSAADMLSDAYDTTRQTVGNVTEQVVDIVSEKTSSAYDATVETLSQAADTVGEKVSGAYDSTREYVEDVASGEKEINYWQLLGGAALGVGAVAVAPLAAGGSLLGAAAFGVAGVVVGANLSGDEKARQAAYDAGRKDAMAEKLKEVSDLKESLAKALESLKVAGEHFNAVIAMHAVAVASAQGEGGLSAEDREGIEMFISGLAASTNPSGVKERIDSMYANPPSVREAFIMARDSQVDMAIFDDIIGLVVRADGRVSPDEAAFVQAWNSLKRA